MKKCTFPLLALLFIFFGCEKNQAPQIISIESLTEIIVGGSEVLLKINTSDENGDALTFNWSVNGGEIISTTTNDSVVWKAPISITGDLYTITVEVSDGELTVEDELIVSVEGGKFIDLRDDNIYEFILIGEQFWMAENLAYLPEVSPSDVGSSYLNHFYVRGYEGTNISEAILDDNYGTYGVLYNWVAAELSCPNGWHLPTDNEWQQFIDHLISIGLGYVGYGGHESFIGKSLASSSGWRTVTGSAHNGEVGHDQESNNDSGFNAFPAGFRYTYRGFSVLGTSTYFWSSYPNYPGSAWGWSLHYSHVATRRKSYRKSDGFSVRCIKDE